MTSNESPAQPVEVAVLSGTPVEASLPVTAAEPTAQEGTAPEAGRRKRVMRSFPPVSFDDAAKLAEKIYEIGAGHKVRRLKVFEELKKSPDSSASRDLVTAASKYGLINGSYKAETLELTPEGLLAVNPDLSPMDRLRARVRLAITSIAPYKLLHERFRDSRLPDAEILREFLKENGYQIEELNECVDRFIANAKSLNLIRTYAGSERLLSLETALEDLPKTAAKPQRPEATTPGAAAATPVDAQKWSNICFYITPIGADDTEHRKHSDLFLNHIVEPALEGMGMRVVRADQIGKPGMINNQIIEHVIRSRLVIADLSYHNPNVFYELAIRHVCKLPTVQVIRSADAIPFDLSQYRTIKIDTASIYTLVPQLGTYKAQIANAAREALADAEVADNPITAFYPGLRVLLEDEVAAPQ